MRHVIIQEGLSGANCVAINRFIAKYTPIGGIETDKVNRGFLQVAVWRGNHIDLTADAFMKYANFNLNDDQVKINKKTAAEI